MHTMTLHDPRGSREYDTAPPTVACFGRYEVLVPLGEGGNASVYIGQTRGPSEVRRLVAIKHLTSNIPHQELWEAAAQEARLGARIRHANVVGVLEVDDGGIGPYIIMDYVEGGTLVDLLGRCFERTGGRDGLPIGIVLRIVLDALFGLNAAHELRDEQGRSLSLVHRDVSPHNILVGADGISKISDFGIARLRHAIRTAPGLVRGKAGYMAPEQLLGQPLDRRTDVFAMGIVLWESLTGNRLFRGKRLEEVISAVLELPIVSPSRIRAQIPEAVSEVCLRALERDPRKRWPTARAFADALNSACRAGATAAIASQGEVADHVEQVLADVLEQQRAAIRLAESGSFGTEDEEVIEPLTVPLRRLPSVDALTADRPLASSATQLPELEVSSSEADRQSITVRNRRQESRFGRTALIACALSVVLLVGALLLALCLALPGVL